MKKIFTILLLIFITNKISAQITLIQFTNGFTSPVEITNAGDKRMFVVEQPGRIYIVDSLGVRNTTPFLNIQPRVLFGGERGLLGLAFAPDYAVSGDFYVNYTRQTDGRTRISRFTVTSNPDIADPNSEQILLTVYQPFSNHNGGNLKFGHDGYLYIGMGDGGSGGDPQNRAQNLDSLLGKMLRIDVSGGSTSYSIPSDNPFVGIAGRDEIWANGLRNPWRWSFDRWNGDLWIGDVGQNNYEEINYQSITSNGGENYGWKCYEANHVYTAGCVPSNNVFPALEISQSDGSCSVIGGFVYRGAEYSNMFNRYFFTDLCLPNIKTIVKNSNGTFTAGNLGTLGGSSIVSFGEDRWGELYIVASGGIIYKLRGASCSPVAYISDEDTIHECVDGLHLLKTPPGSGFSYAWKRDGVVIPGATSHEYPASITGNYTVSVTNRTGCVATSSSVHVVFDITDEQANGGCSVTLNLRLFIETFYDGNEMMVPALYNDLVSNDPTDFDSVTVELHKDIPPYDLVHSVNVLVKINGTSTVKLPPYILNHSYFLAIRHRTALETWSKVPFLFDSNIASFDFTGLE